MSQGWCVFGRVGALALGVTAWLATASTARGDALPFDEETTKGANGSTVILGLERFAGYTVILYPAACISDYEEEVGPSLRLGEGSYDYAIVRDGAAMAGADYGSPNCSMGGYFALPTTGFPVVGGRIPALDRRTVTEVDALLQAGAEGVLKAGRGPAPWAELPKRDRRNSFVEFVRAEIDDAGFRLVGVRTTWSREERREPTPEEEAGSEGGATSGGGSGSGEAGSGEASGGGAGSGGASGGGASGGGASGGQASVGGASVGGASGGGASGGQASAGGERAGGTSGAEAAVGGAGSTAVGGAAVGGSAVGTGGAAVGAGTERTSPSQERGWLGWMIGGVVVGLGGVLFMRRRRG